jgi:hypothetical protein
VTADRQTSYHAEAEPQCTSTRLVRHSSRAAVTTGGAVTPHRQASVIAADTSRTHAHVYLTAQPERLPLLRAQLWPAADASRLKELSHHTSNGVPMQQAAYA